MTRGWLQIQNRLLIFFLTSGKLSIIQNGPFIIQQPYNLLNKLDCGKKNHHNVKIISNSMN